MIDWINSWVQGIIIAVIIGTIIEMILPEGNNKKYIKTVVGIYVIFSIIYPLITKITGQNIDLKDMINKEEYVDSSYVDLGDELVSNTNAQIKDVYIERTKNDIKVRLEDKGYRINRIEIEVELDDDERYGEINSIKLDISKENIEEQKEGNESEKINVVGEVEKINISVSETNSNASKNIDANTAENTYEKENNSLTEEDVNNIKSLLETIYGINRDRVDINI